MLAAWLQSKGITAGSRVVCLGRYDQTFVSLLFATVRLGAVFVPADPGLSTYQLRWLLGDVAPGLVVCEEGRRSDLPADISVATLPDLQDQAITRLLNAFPDLQVDANDVALIIYTSGTTSRPKGIVCPHRAVVFATAAIFARLGYQSSDIVYGRLPLSFDAGLYQIFLCAMAGAALVLPDGQTEAAILTHIRDSHATVLPMVPTLGELVARLALRDNRPTFLRLLTNTGAALTPRLATRLREVFGSAQTIAMYGTSECKRVTIADPDEHLRWPGTVGRPLPGTRVLILDDDGRSVAAGVTGQIVAVGPHVMDGYWQAPELTQQRFRPASDNGDPAYYTGDYGFFDEDGRLYFVGRRDDQFKRRGRRTSSFEIEAAILDIPGVHATAVIPPEPDGELIAWVVGEVTVNDVLRGVFERLGPGTVPDRCVLMADLPRTSNGKIDKHALRSGGGGDRR
jgi:amino acid adenylation domain-containing protein